ncbi:unnamed protein product [marine sediment metagenome]|uniref:Uncharacterized protein n=1 Tax=marine sediment metagenome TaxID=412755 RepID=X0S7A6_9ZZZZ
MGTDLTLSVAAKNAAVDAVVDLCDAGAGAAVLSIMTAGDTILSEHTMTDPAFGASAAGVATAAAIGDDASANATGEAALFKIEDSDSNEVMRGSVGTSGEVINLNSTAIVSGTTVSITALTVTLPDP